MSLIADCSQCGHREAVPDVFAGKSLRCRGCNTRLMLPGPAEDPSVPTVEASRRFVGHRASVLRAVFAPDGRSVVSCSIGEVEEVANTLRPRAGSDYSIRVWDVATGRELRRITGHDAGVTSVAVSPDGRLILSGSDDGTARLWDLNTGQEVRRYDGHGKAVTCVAFSRRGRYAASGGCDRTVRVWEVAGDRLWDLTRGGQLRCLKVEDRPGLTSLTPVTSRWPLDIVFSPDGGQILAGCDDFVLRLWDAKRGELFRLFEGHTERVYGVAFSADGRHILSGSYDGTMRLWEAAGKEVIRLWVGHTITGVALSPDARYAFCSCGGQPAEVWSIPEGRLLCRLGRAGRGTVALSMNNRFVLAADAENTLHLYEVPSAGWGSRP